jgi:hypothetical protein
VASGAFDDEQRLADDRLTVLASTLVIVPAWPASISFMIFIASMMHTGSLALTTLPTSASGLAPGLDAR